jgi:hypothetical protein
MKAAEVFAEQIAADKTEPEIEQVEALEPAPVPVNVPTSRVSQPVSAPRPPARAGPAPRPAASKPYVKPPAPTKPPLEGALSLREALAKATGHKPVVEPAPTPRPTNGPPQVPRKPVPVHAIDLKKTLHAIAPKAEAVHMPAPKAQPARLPEEEIRSMLEVDDNIELDLS